MSTLIESIRSEFLRYKSLAEGTISQLQADQLSASKGDASNSIAVICWHISGNLQSRFTDFLTTDGEKPWRNREEEFEPRAVTRAELLDKWERGWTQLLSALDGLSDAQLKERVVIRGQPLHVHEALHRSLAHLAYHVGQIVYVGKAMRGREWTSLSIPPGGSADYNRNPTRERGPQPR
jgi:uncharacterized damage-inducible protein DinB